MTQGVLRRQDLALPDSEARGILQRAELGCLATADTAGVPYAVPVNYAVDGNKIYIHCAQAGHKLDNIRANPQVGFTVVGEYQVRPAELSAAYRSVIAFGTARLVEDAAEQRQALRLLMDKYAPGYECASLENGTFAPRTVIIEMTIATLTGKRSRLDPQ